MISDVPLGSFLSGGIDSERIVANAARMKPEPLQTFSIGFGEAEYNELEHARTVAKAFEPSIANWCLDPDSLEAVEDLAWHLDEPFADSSAIPTYMVSKLAAQHVKVVLSGDGGDELFAGYDKYLVERRERNGKHTPASARKLMGNISRLMPGGLKGRNYFRHHSMTGQSAISTPSLFSAATIFAVF